jgi:hypothetical protein
VDAALGFLDRTEPIAGVGGGVIFRGGPVILNVGYRYTQIFANDLVGTVLGAGRGLRSNQVRGHSASAPQPKRNALRQILVRKTSSQAFVLQRAQRCGLGFCNIRG